MPSKLYIVGITLGTYTMQCDLREVDLSLFLRTGSDDEHSLCMDIRASYEASSGMIHFEAYLSRTDMRVGHREIPLPWE